MKCPACDKDLKPAPTRSALGAKKYCDVKCQNLSQRQERKKVFLSGGYAGTEMLYSVGRWNRDLLIEQLGYKCNCCGISEWNGKPLTLEVNHKDGKSVNNVIENLEFLCANCHSQTDTFRNKNKGKSTRTYRK